MKKRKEVKCWVVMANGAPILSTVSTTQRDSRRAFQDEYGAAAELTTHPAKRVHLSRATLVIEE